MIFRRKKHHQESHVCCGKHRNYSKMQGNRAKMLSNCNDSQKVLIRNNPDLKTVELGIYSGNSVEVLKNHPADSNMIVRIHGNRFIIPREVADNIQVKAC